MFKTLFTLSIALGSSLLADAQNVNTKHFAKTPHHPLVERIRLGYIQNEVTMRRSSPDAKPDSLHFSSWNAGSWQLNEVSGLRYDAQGRPAQMISYDQPGPLGNVMAITEYSWRPDNQLQRFSVSMVLGSLRQEQLRLQMRYDAFGNKTSAVLMVPDSLGQLTTVFGDSLQYTYNSRHEIESVAFALYDFTGTLGWMFLQQITNIAYQPSGQPLSFEIQGWDDQLMAWSDPVLMDHLQWQFGWAGFSKLFGSIELDANTSVYEPVDFVYYEPTDYLLSLWEQGRLMPDMQQIAQSIGTNRVADLRVLVQGQAGWEDAAMTTFGYNQYGIEEIISHVYDFATQTHLPVERTVYTYGNGGYMASKEMMYYDGTRWQPYDGTTYTYTHQADGKPNSQLVRVFDSNTLQYDNSTYAEFFYNQPIVASNNEQARALPFEVYPNPTSDFVRIRFGAGQDGETTIRVRNLQGQLLLTEKLSNTQETAQISLASLPAGIYLVEAAAGNTFGTLRVVRQ